MSPPCWRQPAAVGDLVEPLLTGHVAGLSREGGRKHEAFPPVVGGCGTTCRRATGAVSRWSRHGPSGGQAVGRTGRVPSSEDTAAGLDRSLMGTGRACVVAVLASD